MVNGQNPTDKYVHARRERQRHVDAVLDSRARHKVVVAGPGTGKSHLFKQILKDKKTPLTLSFINTLVADLALDLCGLSEVKTLHSFARGALAAAIGAPVDVFPKLSTVIREDAKILLNEDVDFDWIFHNRDDSNKHLEFYRHRKSYYDNCYGYVDIIFAATKYLEKHRDRIPAFDQVVVDEFQDFNNLEVSLIDLLSERNPLLLVGDDDQALYDFKSASPEYIRDRHRNHREEYASFVLPYCSRCTRVIVDATNDVVEAAVKSGRLKNRIDKPYLYFDDADKDCESAQSPTLVYTQKFDAQIPWFIEQRIKEIANVERRTFGVLIISPIKAQCTSIVSALRSKGFENIQGAAKRDADGLTVLEGLEILLNDGKSNLGWRIVCQALLGQTDFESLLRETTNDQAPRISDILGDDNRRRVRGLLKILRKVRDDGVVDNDELSQICEVTGVDPFQLAKSALRDRMAAPVLGRSIARKVPIRATTIQSSKGLAEQYVFITHFDDRFFIKEKDKTDISDRDICSFLVALTRAKRKVFLISSEKKDPTFLTWINQNRIERI